MKPASTTVAKPATAAKAPATTVGAAAAKTTTVAKATATTAAKPAVAAAPATATAAKKPVAAVFPPAIPGAAAKATTVAKPAATTAPKAPSTGAAALPAKSTVAAPAPSAAKTVTATAARPATATASRPAAVAAPAVPTKPATAPAPAPAPIAAKRPATGKVGNIMPAVQVDFFAKTPDAVALPPPVAPPAAGTAASARPGSAAATAPKSGAAGKPSSKTAASAAADAARAAARAAAAVVVAPETPSGSVQPTPMSAQGALSPSNRSVTRGAEGMTRKDVMAVFREFDVDGNGTIEPNEFQDFLFELGEVHSLSDVSAIFNKIDKDGSGALDFDEFYSWFTSDERQADASGASKVSSLVKIKLRNRFLARRAKQVEDALKEAARGLATGGRAHGNNRLHLKLDVGHVADSAPFGILLNLTHNDGSALDELAATRDDDADDDGPKERPKSAIYASFTVHPDANDMDVNEWCEMLNGLVAEAAESEEGKEGLIPAYAGFKADVTTVPDSDERIVMIRLFFNTDPFATMLEHLTGREDSRLSDVVKTLKLALRTSINVEELISGKATATPLAASVEALLDADRHSLRIGAAAAGAMAKRFEKMTREISTGAMSAEDEYEDDTELYDQWTLPDGTTVAPGHRRGASAQGAAGGNAFFGVDDDEESGWAERELAKMKQIAAAVEALRSSEDITLKIAFDSFAKMLGNMKFMPGLSAYGGGILVKLARALTNPMTRRTTAIQWLNDWLGSVDPGLADLFQQAKISLKTLNRVALQTRDALLSIDTTGMLLQPLWDLERSAEPQESKVLMIGPSRAGKTRMLQYLCGHGVNVNPEGGRVTEVVMTDSHKLHVTEVRAGRAGPDGKGRIVTTGLEEPDAAILVVDSRKSRAAALAEAKALLDSAADSLGLKTKPLLVLATKGDIPGEKQGELDIATALGLTDTYTSHRIVRCSGATGEAIDEGLSWLCDAL